MMNVTDRSLRITVIAFLIPALFGFLTVLSLAQEPPAVDLMVVPQADYALAGQPFTYALSLTNNGPSPLKDIILFFDIPAGTTLADTKQPTDWYTSIPPAGSDSRIAWATQTPIETGSTVNFNLIINVPPEMAGQQLVCQTYGLVPLGTGNMLASGPPITTQVVAVLPTSTATPIPTATPTTPPSPTATPSPPTTATSLPATPIPATTSTTIGRGGLVIILIFLIMAAGLTWFMKRR